MIKYLNFFNLVHVLQLFRRVAAALPGMDSTENKPPEDSILCSNRKELFLVMSRVVRKFFYICGGDRGSGHCMAWCSEENNA